MCRCFTEIKIILSLLIILLTGCIYTFSGGYPSKYRKVYITEFRNLSDRQDITIIAQENFFSAIEKDGRLNIVSKEKAGMRIEPVIVGYSRNAKEFTSTGEIITYSINLRMIIHTRINDSMDYLKDTVFSGIGTYQARNETEEIGLKRAIEDLVRNFLNKLFAVRL